jgi:hypothetical protein
MGKWAKLRELSGEERALLAGAFLLLPATAFGLRVLGFTRMRKIFAGAAPVANAGDRADGDADRAARTERLVRVAARYCLWRPSCLPRSLTLWRLLRRQGIETELRIGVRKQFSRLDAHAWVEHHGAPLGDAHDVRERYAAFGESIVSGADR